MGPMVSRIDSKGKVRSDCSDRHLEVVTFPSAGKPGVAEYIRGGKLWSVIDFHQDGIGRQRNGTAVNLKMIHSGSEKSMPVLMVFTMPDYPQFGCAFAQEIPKSIEGKRAYLQRVNSIPAAPDAKDLWELGLKINMTTIKPLELVRMSSEKLLNELIEHRTPAVKAPKLAREIKWTPRRESKSLYSDDLKCWRAEQ